MPIIQAIEKLVADHCDIHQATKGRPFDYIMLVGGFGESKLLKRMLEKFVRAVRVIQPMQPIGAVTEGTLLLGQDSSLIRYAYTLISERGSLF